MLEKSAGFTISEKQQATEAAPIDSDLRRMADQMHNLYREQVSCGELTVTVRRQLA